LFKAIKPVKTSKVHLAIKTIIIHIRANYTESLHYQSSGLRGLSFKNAILSVNHWSLAGAQCRYSSPGLPA